MELFDLDSDAAEQQNLYETMKARPIVRGIEDRLLEFIREGTTSNQEFLERNRITPGKEVLEQLRSLGYVN